MRSRTAAESSAVHVRVRRIAARINSESVVPALSALARHTSSSAAVTRQCAIAVR
ncbi:MAG: hypothetical protein OYL92_03855 [Acidobacteriota bacterium]|nr:hypothetical protein [Acidobacteriota bacterium]MDE3264085.1 hypothetical protein [Acidobacteriota bacterium]